VVSYQLEGSEQLVPADPGAAERVDDPVPGILKGGRRVDVPKIADAAL